MWPKKVREIEYFSYQDFLLGPYWKDVNLHYDMSGSTPKYCFVCSSDRFYLHHEDYSILGHELENENFKKLIAICHHCHHAIHFDEAGEKIPLKPEFLKERRMELRRRYIKYKLKHLELYSLASELIYRIFW